MQGVQLEAVGQGGSPHALPALFTPSVFFLQLSLGK